MSIIFKSTKECVDSLNLQKYIKNISKVSSYGHCFEEIVFKNLKDIGTNVRRTSAEFDIVRGADMRFIFDESSVLVDIKLLTNRALRGSKKFINYRLKSSKNEEDLFFFDLGEGLQVAFCLKYFSPLGKIGYCKFEKAVITAVFRCKREDSIHELINKDSIMHFRELVRVVNQRMVENGEPSKVSNSFEFRYHKRFERGNDNDESTRAYTGKRDFNRHQEGSRQTVNKNETR